MSINRLKNTIAELQRSVESWHEGEAIPAIEMDMALERVKKIYEMLRFPEQLSAVAEAVTEVAESEVVTEAEAEIELVAEPEPVISNEPYEDERLKKQERHKRILSLYGEPEFVPEPEPEPETKPEPIEEIVFEEIEIDDEEEVEQEVKVEQEESHEESHEEEQKDMQEPIQEPAYTLHTHATISSQLGINDRLLLTNDLFDGDMEALDSFIERLERQPSLDDAILYIAENYSWSGDQEGAKLLYILLENRFL